MTVEGIILAAGLSGRTAPDCKLAFMLAGQTVLGRSVGSMMPFCAQVYVVTGAHRETIVDILRGQPGIALVHNPQYASGMYGSVKAGLRRTGADRVFILPGDCPFVTAEVYAALLAVRGDIIVPTFHGRDEHPVLLSRAVIQELLRDKACETLRQFIEARHPVRVPVDCPGILTDIDTTDEYRQALLLISGGE